MSKTFYPTEAGMSKEDILENIECMLEDLEVSISVDEITDEDAQRFVDGDYACFESALELGEDGYVDERIELETTWIETILSRR